MTVRNLPDVSLTKVKPGYCRQLAKGWDYWQEAYDLKPTEQMVEGLADAKARALQLSEAKDSKIPFTIGGEPVMCHAYGGGGQPYQLSTDDFLIFIGSGSLKKDWQVSVRYLSAGLWEHGLKALQETIRRLLWMSDEFFGNKTDTAYSELQGHQSGVKVTRADYCFDFHCPTFAEEFRPRLAEYVVGHSSIKSQVHYDVWANSAHGETLNIGNIKGVQVAIYNKAKEITEISGKKWMYDLWMQGTQGEWLWGDDIPTNVWRLEVRMSAKFLKSRNVRDCGMLLQERNILLREALYTRRLTRRNRKDKDRSRWPIHPIWSQAILNLKGDGMMPLGFMVSGTRDLLVERQQKQILGALRSLSILNQGKFDRGYLETFLLNAVDEIEEDPDHEDKIKAARFRYQNVDEAK